MGPDGPFSWLFGGLAPANPNVMPQSASGPVASPMTGDPMQGTPTSGLGPGAGAPMTPLNLQPNGTSSPGGIWDMLKAKFGMGSGNPTPVNNAVQPTNSAKQNQMNGINQIMKTLQGPALKPATFQPMQLRGAPPMQLPQMNLGDM